MRQCPARLGAFLDEAIRTRRLADALQQEDGDGYHRRRSAVERLSEPPQQGRIAGDGEPRRTQRGPARQALTPAGLKTRATIDNPGRVDPSKQRKSWRRA